MVQRLIIADAYQREYEKMRMRKAKILTVELSCIQYYANSDNSQIF